MAGAEVELNRPLPSVRSVTSFREPIEFRSARELLSGGFNVSYFGPGQRNGRQPNQVRTGM